MTGDGDLEISLSHSPGQGGPGEELAKLTQLTMDLESLMSQVRAASELRGPSRVPCSLPFRNPDDDSQPDVWGRFS